ncbi:uncharacterized protein LOC130737039 [Lotus japonicus]|uniref:uncharacterized protein LOC130737039 n=1 Tax=Lotus japonicus TaxID=34305 RepID=UPI0025883CEF|nr:uncharacterized protein LOC130737039 [Lotus japonicus]
MNLLSYNTRGLGSRVKGHSIRNLIQKEKVDFACLQETKLGVLSQSDCQLIWGNEDIEWIHSPAVNLGGGVLCIWRKDAFTTEEVTCNQRWICIRGKWKDRAEEWMIMNIYAPCTVDGKRQLWEEIIAWKRRSNVNYWSVVGDFNTVRCSEERKGIGADSSSHYRRDSELFNEFIEAMELVDIPLTGKKFTWVRPNGSAMSRLDRCLVSLGVLDVWPQCVQQVLDREFSDHCPVLLKQLNYEWGPRPFRVINCWLDDPRFAPFVKESWKAIDVQGQGIFIMKEKLKLLKAKLKQWNV